MNALHLALAPLLPWSVTIAAAALGAALLAVGFWQRARGTTVRALALAALLVTIANPSLVQEERAAEPDVALIVKDVSESQSIGQRARIADNDVKKLQGELARLPGLEVRTIAAGAPPPGTLDDPGTRLFEAATRALADVPPRRVAGIVMVTDGEVHDAPAPDRPGFTAPLHVLLTGQRDEGDRRLIVKAAPSYGIVGKPVSFTVRIEDLGSATGNGSNPNGGEPAEATIQIRKDGGPPEEIVGPVGQDIQIQQNLDHGGPSVFELETGAGPRELTLDNNRAAVVVNGVRDRLHVLLVSGEPHPGERTWRNLLKADPLVDLVHFTILRPPEKQDGTPINQLSLIAFPIRELFDVKLDQFDLIIFDRYNRRGVLPQTYFDNIARYVENGGALLEAAGPVDSPELTLYSTPLGDILPAEPSGQVREEGYKPELTADGYRHPVTADLPGAPPEPAKAGAPASLVKAEPGWGRWFRQIDSTVHRGTTVMSGLGGSPLLVLDRVGQGRVAQLLSDDLWLWTRGFEGGGPQAELMRRLAYWLMKEPDLEENDLRASVEGDRLTIQRRHLKPDPAPVAVTVTRPDGTVFKVGLNPAGGGRETATVPIAESGLYRLTDGSRTALAAAGALNPLEMGDVRTTEAKLRPLVEAAGGGMFWTGAGEDLPTLRRVRPGRDAAGPGWMGFRANEVYTVTGVSEAPLLPAWAALALVGGALVWAWRREGR